MVLKMLYAFRPDITAVGVRINRYLVSRAEANLIKCCWINMSDVKDMA